MGWLEPATSLLRSTLGDEHWQTRLAAELLVWLWIEEAKGAVQRREKPFARQVLSRARDVALPVLGPKHPLNLDIARLGLL
jgi:hypothetical protein